MRRTGGNVGYQINKIVQFLGAVLQTSVLPLTNHQELRQWTLDSDEGLSSRSRSKGIRRYFARYIGLLLVFAADLWSLSHAGGGDSDSVHQSSSVTSVGGVLHDTMLSTARLQRLNSVRDGHC